MYPDLAEIACAQVTFSADIRLSPMQVGALRDTVLALFPAASMPWYFRELFQAGGSNYEIAASVGASTRNEAGKPYNVFLRIVTSEEQGYETPTVSDLLEILGTNDDLRIYCSAHFALPSSEDRLIHPPKQTLHQDRLGRIEMESYSTALYDSTGLRLGTANVTSVGEDGNLCTISFAHAGTLDANVFSALVNRAAELFWLIQRR